MPAGRPTSYTPELLEKTKDYRDNWKTINEGDVLPTIEGLALYINVSRGTIYNWISENKSELKEFLDIVEGILENQAKILVNKGLEGKFAPTIAKVMLSKHDYREGIEQTGKNGKDLVPEPLTDDQKKKLNELLCN